MGAYIAVVGWLLASGAADPPVHGVRRVRIPEADGGYEGQGNQVLDSRARLDEYLAGVKGEDGWHRQYLFVRALSDTPVDFSQEVLVLIFHAEGSASVKVRLRLSEERGGTLRATILRYVPGEQVQVFKHYGYALAVRRDRAARVEVLKQEDVLPIPRR